MPKKTHTKSSVPNPLETVTHLGNDFKESVVKDVAKGGFSDFFKQLLGTDFATPKPSESAVKKSAEQIKNLDPKSGAVELFNAKSHGGTSEVSKKRPEAKSENRAAAIDYHRDIVKSSEKASRVEHNQLDQKIEQITIELRKLVKSSKMLQTRFAEVAVAQAPVNAGEYHTHFLEWMLIMIQNARAKVEDSGAWLNTVKGKGKKGGGYWGMFKKHGTSFGLSNERSVATQTG